MPTPTPAPARTARPVVVHAADAEVLDGTNPMRLLADSDALGGALSVSGSRIAAGAANARPHLHERFWEVFHVLDGALEILLDEEIVTVGRGGLVAVPPGVVHAFGAEGRRLGGRPRRGPVSPMFGRFGRFGRCRGRSESLRSLRSLPQTCRSEHFRGSRRD
ncbi:cupin domain-containing protein [Streptomyces sp. NPDC089799]|uniref:cupin domain-containing protein n=1 Tax=Streptomyces sp. NPDC089799 TaxID=3155066 RepID=UPI00342FDA67